MKIKAAVANAPHTNFNIEELDIDDPRSNEILVKIVGVGICHTDLISRDQHVPVQLPAVLGHEGAGIVEAVGADITKVAVGDKVILSFSSCGHCHSCEDHFPSYCRSFAPLNFLGRRADGSPGIWRGEEAVSGRFFGQSSFASHALVEERNIVKVDVDKETLPLLGALGCGFQTGAGAIINSLACGPQDNLIIIGGGAVGMSAVMAAAICGCKTVLVEPNEKRRELAMELGATAALSSDDEHLMDTIAELFPEGVNKVFDTTGIGPLIEKYAGMLVPRGVIGLVAAASNETSINLNVTQLVVGGVTVKGILEGDSDPDSFIPMLVDYVKAGKFPVDKLSKTFAIENINEAIEQQKSSAFVKAVLIP